MWSARLLGALVLVALAIPATARGVVLQFQTAIAGDSVPVTVTLADVSGGGGVDVTVAIPAGAGDLLGLFGNVGDESLLASMAVDDPSGVVTQWQFQANSVWKIGGGNTMAPVKTWDWGVKLGQTGSPGGVVVESASFRLTAPGLTVAQIVGAATQGWVLGVRIQSTTGPEGSAKVGLSSEAPRIQITTPAAGALLNATPTAALGTVLGTAPAVSVNGVAATVSGTDFSATVPLAEGPNTLTATATNGYGTATDAVDVVLDTTPPVVTIRAPPDGTLTTLALVTVSGTVTDASPIASFSVNGAAVPLDASGAFTTSVLLPLGDSAITATAVDAAGNPGSASVHVLRGVPPTISLDAPADGTLTDQTPIATSGQVTGIPAPTVTVNGVTASLSGQAFTASVPLTEGANTLTATATNAFGTAQATVSVTLNRLPTISTVTPATGSAGTEITISGSNFAVPSGALPVVQLTAQGGGTIDAPVVAFDGSQISFTIPPSAASGPITVTVDGHTVTSASALTITPPSDFALSASPASVALMPGVSVGVNVQVGSTSGLLQTVALAVSGVPAGVTAEFDPPSVAPGQSSLLTLQAPAGQATGAATLQVSGSATLDGFPVTRTADVALTIKPLTTSFVGRTVVDDPAETPLAGVTVKFLGLDGAGGTTACSAETTSDAAGNFALTNLPAGCLGPQLIRYDGSTTTAPSGRYAGVDLLYHLADGQATASPVLVHLPRIDNKETVMVVQNDDVDQTFRFSSIPNLSITVYAGTTLTLPDGSQPNPFPLTAVQVPIDRLPAVPPTAHVVAPFIVAFQPADTVSSQPIAVTFPNLINTPPGTSLTLVTLDPTLGKMVPYGTGTVSNDGQAVVPDEDPARPGKRFGLVHFDWHGSLAPAATQINACAPCATARKSDPVHFGSGLVIEQHTDLAIPGPGGGISIQRVYRTLSSNAGPFGIGGFFNYSYFLGGLAAPRDPVVDLIVPAGNRFPFVNNGDGTFTNRTEPSLRGAVMKVHVDGTVDVTFKDGRVFHFVFFPGISSGSALQSITDPNGNRTTLVRNPENARQITEIIDAVGRKLTLSYDGSNRITQVTDPIGRTVKYTYTSFGHLATVTDPEGGVTRFTYVRPDSSTESNELETITDARGVVIARNSYGLVYGPACDGATGLSADDLAALPQAERDACLNDPETVRDQRVWKQIRADGGVLNFRYTLSSEGLPQSPVIRAAVTDAFGDTTTYRFSPQGQPLGATDPLGQSTTFDREPGNSLLLGRSGSATCELCGDVRLGDITDARDGNGNIVSTTDTLGQVTTFTYDPRFNKPLTVTDALGHTTQFAYDAHGNLLSLTDADGNKTGFRYNSRGLPVGITDAAGNSTAFAYDAFGNLVSATDALGNISRFAYDGVGRLIEAVDPLGRHTKFAYDKLDRVVSKTDAKGQITTFQYDSVGNLLSVTDAKGNTVSFTYDAVDRLATRTDAAGKTESFTYDQNGNLIQTTDRRGEINHFAYDALNRLVKATYADGSTVTNTYDARGRLVRVADSVGGVETLDYDAIGRLVQETTPNGTLVYQYDALGRVISRQVVGGPAVTYTYDPFGNLLSASSPQASVAFSYDALNHRIGIERGNGVTTTATYDPLGRLVSLVDRSASGVLDQQTYGYDAVGNRASLASTLGAPFVTASAQATYDDANRLLSRGSATYTHDANGNRLTKTTPAGVTHYAWDARNRLRQITEPDGTVTTFRYDAFNRLLSEGLSGPAGDHETAFVVDDLDNVVRETDSRSGTLSILTGRTIDDSLAVTRTSGTPVYLLRDALNSTVATTDAAGQLAQTFHYEPYGELSTESTSFPIQYTGRLPVSAGLYYVRARFYDPAAGRFLSEDPMGEDPLGLARGGVNLYAYVFANPVNGRDPSGLGPNSEEIVKSGFVATCTVAGCVIASPEATPVGCGAGFVVGEGGVAVYDILTLFDHAQEMSKGAQKILHDRINRINEAGNGAPPSSQSLR